MNKLIKNKQTYLEIDDNFTLNFLETENFLITSNEYTEFIKNSNLKNHTITCNIKESENQKNQFLLT